MDAASILAGLKPAFTGVVKRLNVKVDAPTEYSLVARKPSPFPQHKGNPLEFACIRVGKAYVSVHLLPIYMDPELQDSISDALKKRMQGKSCFNFRSVPEAELVADLKLLANAGLKRWQAKGWT